MYSEAKTGRGRRIGRYLAAVLCLALLAGAFAGTSRASAAEKPRQEMSAADIYEQNVDSTVGITTTITTNIWGYQTTSAVSGSGFIITDDGYILTNYHVVEGAETITVTTYGGDSYDAELVGRDESNDIAVLKVDAKGLAPVTIGDSGDLRVGDEVIAIGNPLGELTFSLTGGRVSALNREITVSNGVTMDLIQTDCAINSGNSGGALFNMYGEVIGITNAKYSARNGSTASIDNIAFAIPISRVYGVVESIMDNGTIAKPFIGVTVGDVGEEALSFGLPAGAAVKAVEEDSPAEKAGIEVNDIVTAVDGEPVNDRGDLADAVAASKAGDTLTLTVYRQGESIEVKVEVGQSVRSALPEEPSGEDAQQQEQIPYGSIEDFISQFPGGSDS